MIAVIQSATHTWPKNERGAEFASERNSRPIVFPIEDGDQLVKNEVYDLCELKNDTQRSFGDYIIQLTPQDVTLLIPNTFSPEPRLMPIKNGQWLQLIYNFRQVDHDTGDWHFGETVVNIGKFKSLNESAFVQRPPHQVCDCRRNVNWA